jgi:frataxin-like iron-binding protein CyaY
MIILIISVADGAFAQQNNPDKKKLTGTWVYKMSDNNVVLKILENNQLVFDGETSLYMLVPNAIRVFDEYGGAFDYQYTLNDGELSVTFPDGNQYVFTKQKAGSVSKMNTNSGGTFKNLYGNFCHYSSSSGLSSSYSTTQSLYFDGKGNFAYDSEGSYSGDNGIYSSGGNGRKFSGTYKVKGKIVTLNFFDGYNYDLKVYFVQQSGEITEIDYDGTVYAKSLCE